MSNEDHFIKIEYIRGRDIKVGYEIQVGWIFKSWKRISEIDIFGDKYFLRISHPSSPRIVSGNKKVLCRFIKE